MTPVETELTPELAAHLLAGAHPKQRRPARATVEMYTRAIKEGRWRLVADAILVDADGHMFNGGHRCAAVIAARRPIPILIVWDADPALFDVIDVGRRRSAYQFISEADAAARASAARVTLWYTRRFERPLGAPTLRFDLSEILDEADARAAAFEVVTPLARKTYEYTGLAISVVLAAYALAHEMGYTEELEAFVRGVEDPAYLPPGDACRLLTERFRKQAHRSRRRQSLEDWTVLVRALNMHLEGRTAARLQMGEFWPRVAETETDFRRRRNAAKEARLRAIQRDKSHAATRGAA